jgi:hypothetical protein
MSVDITDLSNQQKLDEFTSKLYRISCELSTLKWRFDQAVSPEAKEASRQAYEQKLSEYDSTLNELEKWVGSLR